MPSCAREVDHRLRAELVDHAHRDRVDRLREPVAQPHRALVGPGLEVVRLPLVVDLGRVEHQRRGRELARFDAERVHDRLEGAARLAHRLRRAVEAVRDLVAADQRAARRACAGRPRRRALGAEREPRARGLALGSAEHRARAAARRLARTAPPTSCFGLQRAQLGDARRARSAPIDRELSWRLRRRRRAPPRRRCRRRAAACARVIDARARAQLRQRLVGQRGPSSGAALALARVERAQPVAQRRARVLFAASRSSVVTMRVAAACRALPRRPRRSAPAWPAARPRARAGATLRRWRELELGVLALARSPRAADRPSTARACCSS